MHVIIILCLVGSKVFNQQLKDVKVPVKYQTFQGLLLKKVELISEHKEDGPPILNWQQILRYVSIYMINNLTYYLVNF